MASEIPPPSSYAHSPAHFFLISGDLLRLQRLLSSLPRLSHPSLILSPSDSLLQSLLSSQISSVLDRRDVPHRDSPLHLAVRLLPLSSALSAVSSLSLAGADPSLPNSSGWTPLHLALSLRRRPLAAVLLRHHRLSAWSKLRRRLPSLLPSLRRVPDFQLDISLRFDSPLLPFLPKSALPSEDVRITKRNADVRADCRKKTSFLFLAGHRDLAFGSLLVMDRERREVRDAFDGADEDAEVEAMVAGDATACRPGVDICDARLVPCTNWRRRERVENVGGWRARVYELQNVIFRVRKLGDSSLEEEELLPELRLDEDVEEGFIVAEVGDVGGRRSCCERGGFARGGEVEMGRRRSVDGAAGMERLGVGSLGVRSKEKEVVKNLKPMVWLTEDFPLKTEEILPMLDVLADKIKVVKQLRELLTTKFPVGTFPVKVAIPIVPTVRMIITFTKFISLQPPEQFFTPLSSPRHLPPSGEEEDHRKPESATQKSWLKWSSSSATKSSVSRSKTVNPQVDEDVDPFIIPSDYKWVSIRDKGHRIKTSNRSRNGKQKDFG